MAKKKIVKSTPAQMIESLTAKVGRLKKKLKAAVDGAKKRKAKKSVKRTQRRKRTVAASIPKAPAAT